MQVTDALQAKEYLLRVQKTDDLIRAHLAEAERLREQAQSVRSPGFGGGGSGTHSGNAPFASSVEALIEMERQISDETARLLKIRLEARKRIETMADPDERLVLLQKYISGSTWDSISDITGKSLATIFRIHKDALEHFPLG